MRGAGSYGASEARGADRCGDRSEEAHPRSQGPRARLAALGARALADHELIALLLRPGRREPGVETVARELLTVHEGLEGLASADFAELESLPGIGSAKAASLVAAFDLGRRLAEVPFIAGRPVGGPVDVERHFVPRLGLRDRESFHVLVLDGRHRLIREEEVSVGTLTASLVHPREVFRGAIRASAAAIVLVHNHPSGDPSPSAEDRSVTHRLAEAGRVLGIEVLDHVVVARGGHFSFREAGELSTAVS